MITVGPLKVNQPPDMQGRKHWVRSWLDPKTKRHHAQMSFQTLADLVEELAQGLMDFEIIETTPPSCRDCACDPRFTHDEHHELGARGM